MVRPPCCDEINVKKGPWMPEEDKTLVEYIKLHGHGSWRNLPKNAGLNRCGKSCRLRWTNYLRPDIKRGKFSEDEERLIIHLHSVLGNKWSTISTHLPGRTDHEIKNYWNTHLKKKLLLMGIDPVTHRRRNDLHVLAGLPNLLVGTGNVGSLANPLDKGLRLHADAADFLAKFGMPQNFIHLMSTPPNTEAMSLLGSAFLGRPQLNDPFQLNHQLEGIVHGASLILSQDQDLRASSILLGLNNLNIPNIFQARADSSIPFEMMTLANYDVSPTSAIKMASKSGINNLVFSSCDMPDAHSTPWVSASPENKTADCMQEQQDPCCTSASTPFQPWKYLNLGEPDDDFSWKDILDQLSSSNQL